MRKQVAAPGLKFYPATAARWPDIEDLFGERGACGGCWCMVWRLSNKDWIAGKGADNRRAFREIVVAGQAPGVIGYTDGAAVAWCAIAPRETYSFLSRSRVLRPVDSRPVWSISCLFIAKPFRRQGLSVQTLVAAVEFAAHNGGIIVEGYPTEATMKSSPDAFLWTGLPSAFRKAGFTEVERRSQNRPIMRCAIGTGPN